MALLVLMMVCTSVSAQYYMNIRKSDGTKAQYSVSEVDSVWFSPAPSSVDLGFIIRII